jgi:hypothetical protein
MRPISVSCAAVDATPQPPVSTRWKQMSAPSNTAAGDDDGPVIIVARVVPGSSENRASRANGSHLT